MMEAPDSPPAETTPSNSQSATSTAAAAAPTSISLSPSVTQSASSNTGSKSVGGNTGKPKVDFGAPGSAWSSKKHLDEHTRAMNSLVDLDTDANCRSMAFSYSSTQSWPEHSEIRRRIAV